MLMPMSTVHPKLTIVSPTKIVDVDVDVDVDVE